MKRESRAGFGISPLRGLLAATLLSAGLALLPATTAHAVDYNPCAQLDLSRIAESHNGKLYKYCWTTKRLVYCGGLNFIKVRDWKKYQVKHKPAGCKNHW